MIQVSISEEIKNKVPQVTLACIHCQVCVTNMNDILWDEIRHKITEISSEFGIEQISSLPAVAASRKAYKACGKDPARYRLSAEALLRRSVNRQALYQVNNVVDLLNLVSISTGFSIGGYDSDKIDGNVVLGVGRTGEPYSGIGRGELNIENMPVFRDNQGAFGTPTSDSERTAVTPGTKRFLMIIFDFGGGDLQESVNMAVNLLERYGYATEIETKIITT